MNTQKLRAPAAIVFTLMVVTLTLLGFFGNSHVQRVSAGTHDGGSTGFGGTGSGLGGNGFGGSVGGGATCGNAAPDGGGQPNGSSGPDTGTCTMQNCNSTDHGDTSCSTVIIDCPAPLIAGVCATTHNNCAVGSYRNGSAGENQSGWSWGCNSPDGGATAACFEAKPRVNGMCSIAHFNCSVGNPRGASDNATQWFWSCGGINGGATMSCTENKPTTPPTPVTAEFTANGSTDLTVNVGTVMNYAWSSINGTSWNANYTTSASCPGGPGPSIWTPAHGSSGGSDNSTSVTAAQAGCVYTMNYTASNPMDSETATVVVRVNVLQPQCSDGVDNSDPEDTVADYPNDPGCTSLSDADETDTTLPPPPPPSLRSCNGTELLGCQLDFTPHGGTDGTCNPATYSGVCSYTCNDSAWGSPSNNSCVLLTPPGSNLPKLTAPKTVQIGVEVDLTWDTNNTDETLCSLTGGTLSLTGAQMNNGTGDNETGEIEVIVNGRTTYTLTCPAGTSVQTIEVIPGAWES